MLENLPAVMENELSKSIARRCSRVESSPDVVAECLEWAFSEGVAFWGMYQGVSADHIS